MTTAIKPTQNVQLLERRADQTIVYNALVMGISMDPQLAGANGEPALELVFINQFANRHAGSADWHHALSRVGDVVNSTHKDWAEGRAALCYEEIPAKALAPDAIVLAPSELAHLAARTAHEANRILCCVLGDYSQPIWHDAPTWQQDSAFAGTEHIRNMPGTTPADSHASWMAQKIADGWVYGPVKDPVAKTHPCIVPYEGLPPAQQMKDWMFGATVRAVYDLPQTATAAPSGATQPNETAAADTAGNLPAPAEAEAPEPVAAG